MKTKALWLVIGLILLVSLAACKSEAVKISIEECDSVVLMQNDNYSADFTSLGEDRPIFVELQKIYESLELQPCSDALADKFIKLRFLKNGELTAAVDLDENGNCKIGSSVYTIANGAAVFDRLIRIYNTDKIGNMNY